MCFDRVHADAQLIGNLLITVTRRHALQDFLFPVGKLFQANGQWIIRFAGHADAVGQHLAGKPQTALENGSNALDEKMT